MLGLTLPLYALAGVESLFMVLLMLPYPLNAPGVFVARQTNGQIGRTILLTLSAFLLLLLVSPIIDLAQLHKHKDPMIEGGAGAIERRESEASSHLSAVMAAGVLGLMWVERKLGLTLALLHDTQAELATYKPADADAHSAAPAGQTAAAGSSAPAERKLPGDVPPQSAAAQAGLKKEE